MVIAVNVSKPWGILQGVRPTKLVHNLYDIGCSRVVIREILQKKYFLDEEKIQLLLDVARLQRNMPGFIKTAAELKQSNISVYIGIPFCPSRCIYCSFTAEVRPCSDKMESFLQVLFYDMEQAGKMVKDLGKRVQTLYIGGGTPTSLNEKELKCMLETADRAFDFQNIQEITVEAGRADSIDAEKIAVLEECGVNRVAVNPQTMHDRTLQAIGRNHSVADFMKAAELLRNSGKFIISMDVIAGLPNETAVDFMETLHKVTELRPDNITVHNLAIKQGSRLKENLKEEKGINEKHAIVASRVEHDVLQSINDARHMLKECGYYPYYLYRQKYTAGHAENVGYALWGKECLYNVQVMEERQSIIGVGAGAMSKCILSLGREEKKSLKNFHFPKDVVTYIKNIRENCRKRKKIFTDI